MFESLRLSIFSTGISRHQSCTKVWRDFVLLNVSMLGGEPVLHRTGSARSWKSEMPLRETCEKNLSEELSDDRRVDTP